MYAHHNDHRTTGVAFGNGTLGGVPTTEPVRPAGGREERAGAVPGERTVHAAATAGDAAATSREVSARV